MLDPAVLLAAAVAALVAVVVATRAIQGRRARRFVGLARRHGFNYSPTDRFALAARLGRAGGPFGHVAGVTVRDVFYRVVGGRREFVFGVAVPVPNHPGAWVTTAAHAVEPAGSGDVPLASYERAPPGEDGPSAYERLLARAGPAPSDAGA